MTYERFVPGGAFVNETNDDEAFIPGWMFLEQVVAAAVTPSTPTPAGGGGSGKSKRKRKVYIRGRIYEVDRLQEISHLISRQVEEEIAEAKPIKPYKRIRRAYRVGDAPVVPVFDPPEFPEIRFDWPSLWRELRAQDERYSRALEQLLLDMDDEDAAIMLLLH